MNYLSMTGVMFDEWNHKPWPTADEVDDSQHSNYRFAVPTDMGEWFAIGVEPSWIYGDESHEAMDRTNWDALMSHLGEVDSIGFDDALGEELAEERGVAMVGGVLLVRPGHRVLEVMEELRGELRGYPLLDEDAYSALEWEAWERYVDDGLKLDTERELRADYGFGDDQLEYVNDHWSDLAAEACGRMHYYYGFTGEHFPPMPELIAAIMCRTETV